MPLITTTWVNSEPRKWRTGTVSASSKREKEYSAGEVGLLSGDSRLGGEDTGVHGRDGRPAVPQFRGLDGRIPSHYLENTSVTPLDALVSAAVGIQLESPISESIGTSHGSPYAVNHFSPSTSTGSEVQPLANIEEACLLRYFIEELSPWFDHCDSQSHFRLVVPLRAHHCLTLRNAIFAVSSRHLSRLPQYKTAQGIVYHGQVLPNLTTSSAVEYMLKCIPGLLSFHTVQDPQDQEHLMAAAIILRQGTPTPTTTDGRQQRVNFLAITQTIIYSMISTPFARSSLAAAAYWIAIRQEVYYALTRKRAPCVTFTAEDWTTATPANIMIMHAGQVTKWCWGDRSIGEYERLKHHQAQLITDYAAHFLPILQTPPDKSKGDIFPTVWYTTDAQVTGVQHLELARMILIAENPRLRNPSTPRALPRKAEAQVRSIVLDLCGIALGNASRRLPALVNAVISILLYGEYFSEQRERDALRGVIERTRDMRAWPLRRSYERLCALWEVVDSVEV
ncbi:hypothetical protein BDW62DRAFT_213055 [Aspergillus aurantiobrunneus]